MVRVPLVVRGSFSSGTRVFFKNAEKNFPEIITKTFFTLRLKYCKLRENRLARDMCIIMCGDYGICRACSCSIWALPIALACLRASRNSIEDCCWRNWNGEVNLWINLNGKKT